MYVFYYMAEYVKEQEIATSGILRSISSLKCFITLWKMNDDLESWSKSFLLVQCNLLVTKLEKVLLCLAVLLSSILNIHLDN